MAVRRPPWTTRFLSVPASYFCSQLPNTGMPLIWIFLPGLTPEIMKLPTKSLTTNFFKVPMCPTVIPWIQRLLVSRRFSGWFAIFYGTMVVNYSTKIKPCPEPWWSTFDPGQLPCHGGVFSTSWECPGVKNQPHISLLLSSAFKSIWHAYFCNQCWWQRQCWWG